MKARADLIVYQLLPAVSFLHADRIWAGCVLKWCQRCARRLSIVLTLAGYRKLLLPHAAHRRRRYSNNQHSQLRCSHLLHRRALRAGHPVLCSLGAHSPVLSTVRSMCRLRKTQKHCSHHAEPRAAHVVLHVGQRLTSLTQLWQPLHRMQMQHLFPFCSYAPCQPLPSHRPCGARCWHH